MTKTVDWLVASAAVLEGVETIKAVTWTEAVDAFARAQAVSGRVVCIPVSEVHRARVETFPTPTVTPE
jgi:hypothetical protein